MFVIKRVQEDDKSAAYWNEEQNSWFFDAEKATKYFWSMGHSVLNKLHKMNMDWVLVVERYY